jgi:hypothetical protein
MGCAGPGLPFLRFPSGNADAKRLNYRVREELVRACPGSVSLPAFLKHSLSFLVIKSVYLLLIKHMKQPMAHYKYTPYFENEVLRKRPYIQKEWCIQVLENPIRIEPQEGNRWRFWGRVQELEGRVLRVVTLEDKATIHNAFPDRGFKE